MESARRRKVYILVGATGVGKSTTGNTIYKYLTGKLGKFCTSDGTLSETDMFDPVDISEHNIVIYDTPGFGDTGKKAPEVKEILKKLCIHLAASRELIIDGFFYAVYLTPRPSTLKKDFEALVSVFGETMYKNLIMILIDLCPKPNRGFHSIYNDLNSEGCEGLFKDYLRVKGESELNPNCFVLWDNLRPVPEQEAFLMIKAKLLPPYVPPPAFAEEIAEAQKTVNKIIAAIKETKVSIEELAIFVAEILPGVGGPLSIVNGAKIMWDQGLSAGLTKVIMGVAFTVADVITVAGIFATAGVMSSVTFAEIMVKAGAAATTSEAARVLIKLTCEFGVQPVLLVILNYMRSKLYSQ